jgi:hypothetical protein
MDWNNYQKVYTAELTFSLASDVSVELVSTNRAAISIKADRLYK